MPVLSLISVLSKAISYYLKEHSGKYNEEHSGKHNKEYSGKHSEDHSVHDIC